MKRQLIFLILFLCFLNARAQNDKIVDLLKSGKGKSGGSYSDGPGNVDLDDIFFFFYMFQWFGEGLVYLQDGALGQRARHPEVVSLEGSLYGGTYTKYLSTLYVPQLRANWGIFSTEFRYQRIDDQAALLESVDWQVIKMNIPVYPVVLRSGMGFSYIPQADQTYFEYSFNGSLRFLKDKALAELSYRGTEGRFRKEFRSTLDYEIRTFQAGKNSKFRISPMIGYMYQNYFSLYTQHYILAGFNLRLY